jgi:predicted metal-binding protein
MNPLEGYCSQALDMGFTGAKVIDPRTVVTAEWVRMKCQFGCVRYGTSHCCPPYAPTPQTTRQVIDSYTNAILVHRRVEGGRRARDFTHILVRLERTIFLDGYHKAWCMGSGPCSLCKACDPKGPCQHGGEARPSMEACGIDVFSTARDNGFTIRVVRTLEDEQNQYGVILVK